MKAFSTLPYTTQTDFAFYAVALLLGLTIVLVNNLPTGSASATKSDLAQILSKMDLATAHLVEWQAQDISQ